MKRRLSSGFISLFAKLVRVCIILLFFVGGGLIIWAARLPLPTLDNFDNRVVEQTTKIYDRTGEYLLYDVYKNVRRTVVPLADMSPHIRNATIAIEDDNFYNHIGIEPTAILRAVLINTSSFEFTQGGSTLTQQVVKNSLLTQEKKISRKLKEWILSLKLDASKSKDEILEIYLNETPYGGSLYGVEAAAQAFFKKSARDLSLAEAAYLAALPQAPTYYSPFGSHREALEERKNAVLQAMRDNEFITDEELEQARTETVEFEQQNINIQAPHFVMYVREIVAEMFGENTLERGGLQVITTLDVEMQQKAQEIVTTYALENETKFNAENAGMVVIDPPTGQILSMVGSRGYFDENIDGNFNVTTARRQPGSVFKPFAYAEAFRDGYTPETVLFNLKTQFSTTCSPSNLTNENGCYSPGNYDGKFTGPMTMRDALAQSVNIPAIKTLYLAGLNETFELARQMGIESLTDPDQYGLTLVLGGGEVSLLDITSAYGVFANNGVRHKHTPLLSITDNMGDELYRFNETTQGDRVLEENVAHLVSDVLSDNTARAPAFGGNSFLNIPGYDVAAKTGTTNDYRDAWIVGYTPTLAVGTWAGNNDNSPMEKRVAGFIVAPMWREFMDWALTTTETRPFPEPIKDRGITLKPVLRGEWNGGRSHLINTITNTLATENTPFDVLGEMRSGGVHSILHWVNKNDPRGAIPDQPATDPQYNLWEFPVRLWVNQNNIPETNTPQLPNKEDDVHTPEHKPRVEFRSPEEGRVFSRNDTVFLEVEDRGSRFDLTRVQYYLNGTYLGSSTDDPFFSFSFVPELVSNNLRTVNMLSVIVRDEVGNESELTGAILLRP